FQVRSRDEMLISDRIFNEDGEVDIERSVVLPLNSAFSMIHRISSTLALKGLELKDVGTLPTDNLEKLFELLPFIAVLESISVFKSYSIDLFKFKLRSFVENLRRNRKYRNVEFRGAILTVTAEELMEIRSLHMEMFEMEYFFIRIECFQIEDIIFVSPDGSLIRRELHETGNQGRMVTFLSRDKKNPLLF
ncbi:hypothetical protein PFISCL1PPCAC_6630, partial [Pristionchus fissidentatus]